MDKNKLNLYGIIICVALLLAAIGVIVSMDVKIANLKLMNKAYEAQQQQLETQKDSLRREIDKTEKQIARLTNELNNIPTDEEIIHSSPIVYVTYDDVWRTITQPIEESINFSRRGDSLVSN